MYRIGFAPMIHTDCFGRFRQLGGRWISPRDLHEWNNLVFVLHGECSFHFECQNRTVDVHSGEAVLIPAGVAYRGNCQRDCEYYFFHFYNSVIEIDEDTVRKNLRSAEQQVTHSAAEAAKISRFRHPQAVMDQIYLSQVTDVSTIMNELNVMLAECDIEKRKTDVNRMLRCDLIFSRIVTSVSEIAVRDFVPAGEYPLVLSKLLHYIHENDTKKLTLTVLSDTFGLSKQHISRLFRSHIGTTVTKYIHDRKLSHAPELLCHSAMNISEIAYYLGFSSPHYFSRLFREKYGIQPQQYIRMSGMGIPPSPQTPKKENPS